METSSTTRKRRRISSESFSSSPKDKAKTIASDTFDSSHGGVSSNTTDGPSRGSVLGDSTDVNDPFGHLDRGKARRLDESSSAAASSSTVISSKSHRSGRLMSLADMSFKTVQTHLSTSLDREEISEIHSYLLDTSSSSLLSPNYLNPLLQSCTISLTKLNKLDRAKKLAQEARIQEKNNRPCSIALDSPSSNAVNKYSGSKRGMAVVGGFSRERKEKSTGGKKIWNKARLLSTSSGTSGGTGSGRR
ncbi:unnamed protein product [Sympodiomycopsis kandeliae]